MECAISFGDVETEADFAQMAGARAGGSAVKFEGAELGLRVRQDVFDGRKLQEVARIARTEAEALATIYHGAAQAESDRGDAVSEGHGFYGIEVVRTHNSRKIGIEARAMHRAYHLLQNHRHLFFFQTIRGGAHVGLGVLAEG